MTNTITYPAAYHVLSCDEMTYTEGGVGVVQARLSGREASSLMTFPPASSLRGCPAR